MATEVDRMVVRLIGDASSYRSMMKEASSVTRQTESLVGRSGRAMGSVLASATKAAVAFGAAMATAAVAGVAKLGMTAIKLAATAEQTQIAFEVMTGSAETATKLVADIRQMGAMTPFEASDLESATKVLLNFGRTAGEVLDDLDMLSNVAGGDKNRLQSLALVFGQIAANGKLMGQDLLQLINAGFNPLLEISKRTGESMTELRDRMSKGEVSFEEVRQAFSDVTSEGGRFFQMNEKQSQTLLGMWSTLKDEVTQALREIGVSITEEFDMKEALAKAREFIETFKTTWGPYIVEGIKNAASALDVLADGFLKVSQYIEDVQHQMALTELQDKGMFMDFNLEEFKAFVKLHKDLDAELKNINQTLADNKLQTFAEAEADIQPVKPTLDPEMQALGDFLKGKDSEDADKLIKQMKDEAAAAGLAGKELALYEARKVLASESQLEMVATLHDEIQARQEAADALKEQMALEERRQQNIKDTIAALREQVETYGMSRKELALYKAEQEGATPAQLAIIGALHDELEAKEDATKATEEAKKAEERFQRSIKGFGIEGVGRGIEAAARIAESQRLRPVGRNGKPTSNAMAGKSKEEQLMEKELALIGELVELNRDPAPEITIKPANIGR